MSSVTVESRKPGQNSEVQKLYYQTEVTMSSGAGIFAIPYRIQHYTEV